ncbi:transcriptional repressor LexA [Fusibacter ferrireducens]|uniref:LexA repressor n=1 Tax=Fusibacter ferrireducens TaxID=2785058 RepID=A0ABR9ZN19_9FIRM|nr:transcriptional repressor LexA [Fusibacter ferrireducens]MBF4691867.1 transcriptional repressor LexA [Fusibacter ferrireducens]
MSATISKKQKQILDFLKDEVSKKGYPPSVREICLAVGLKSTSTVHMHLTKLEELGYIRRDPTKPRAIEIFDNTDHAPTDNVTDLERNTKFIPIIGEITAGQPILAVESFEDTFPIPSDFVDEGNYFMLKIKGDSMIEAGIHDRDLVLVKQQSIANNGEIVVAMIDDSATVKTFYKEQSRIRLQPENSSMLPIYADDVQILGRVRGVFRKM